MVRRTRRTSPSSKEGGDRRSPWNHRCPRGPLNLLHHHKNNHDSKTPATATTLPTAPKTRKNKQHQIPGSKSRRVSQIQKHQHRSTTSVKNSSNIQITTTNMHEITTTKMQRENGVLGDEAELFWGMKQNMHERTGFWG
jgi:hypothetical protein